MNAAKVYRRRLDRRDVVEPYLMRGVRRVLESSSNPDAPAAAESAPVRRRRAFLFSMRSDGSPTCHPMVASGQGDELIFSTYRTSRKAQNLLTDPRASCLVLEDWQASPHTARGVVGEMEVVDMVTPEAIRDRTQSAGAVVPQGVRGHTAKRLADGKRLLFRLRSKPE